MQFVLSGSCYNCSSVTNTFAVLDADTLFILQQAQLHKMTILTLGRKSIVIMLLLYHTVLI